MTDLPRIRPHPIPEIHPVPEYLADGPLARRYDAMKTAFQVPWMGVVTMAFAHYRHFYDTLWDGLMPLCTSRAFVDACRELRAFTEAGAALLAPPPIAARLAAIGYAPRELDAIRAMVDVFSHGNFPYLLLATLARRLLEGAEMSDAAAVEAFTGRHAPDLSVPFVLMEAHHADPATRAVYADVKASLRLPFVNTDYRAFARWPSYFALAWSDLRGQLATAPYEALVGSVHAHASALAASLPNPGGLTSAALRASAAHDAEPAEVRDVVRLFQWLLPGLVSNVAWFRAQLQAPAT
ncbi:MAG: hypothetical protein KGL52_13310 [Rhodospirillales bacterium]|nr:hypothetical protein [Rhodospirillales bacterium]